MKTSYCQFCGKPAGEGHKTWCPLYDELGARAGETEPSHTSTGKDE